MGIKEMYPCMNRVTTASHVAVACFVGGVIYKGPFRTVLTDYFYIGINK